MTEKVKNSKIIILLLLTGAVYFFLKYLTPLISPVLTAMLFVTIFGPMMKKMQEKFHIHRQISAIVLLLWATVILTSLLWILFSWIIGSLPQWIQDMEALYQDIQEIVRSVCQAVGNTIGVDSLYLEATILGHMKEGIAYFQKQTFPGMLSQSWTYLKLAGAAGGFLVTFIIASVLLAKDYDHIMNRMLEREECHLLLEVICGMIRYIATFVKAQVIIMSMIALLCAVGLGAAGIRHGVLWGLLAGVLDALPFIGTGIILIPLALSQIFYGNYGKAAVCILLYVGAVFLRELTEPRLIGKRIGVPVIAVLLSLYAGIQLFGVWGIIKGPLGFVLIYQTYLSMQKRFRQQKDEEGQEEEREATPV